MKTLFLNKGLGVYLERYPKLQLFFGKNYIFIKLGWLYIDLKRKV